MKFKFTLLFLLAVVVLAIFTYDQMKPPFQKGTEVPFFSLSDLDGKTVSLKDFAGSPLLIHFWATWCGSCNSEMPLLEDFAVKHPNIKVVAISEDDGGTETIKGYFKNIHPPFAVLIDTLGNVADNYKSYKIPETYLVDKDGKFVRKFSGAVSWNDPVASQYVLTEAGIAQ